MRYKDISDEEMIPKWLPHDNEIPPKYWLVPVKISGKVELSYCPVDSAISIRSQSIADAGSSFDIEDLGKAGWLLLFEVRGCVILDGPDLKSIERLLQSQEIIHTDDAGKIVVTDRIIEIVGSITTITHNQVLRLNTCYKGDPDESS